LLGCRDRGGRHTVLPRGCNARCCGEDRLKKIVLRALHAAWVVVGGEGLFVVMSAGEVPRRMSLTIDAPEWLGG